MLGKRKYGVKKARKQKQRKGCGRQILVVLLLFIIAGAGIGCLKWTGILDGIGLPLKGQENSKRGETKKVEFLNLTHCSERKVTDERSAKEALKDMQADIGFESIDEFSAPTKNVADAYTFYKFDQLYQGVPVVESSLILTVGPTDHIRNVTGNYSNPAELSKDEVLQEYAKSIEVSAKEDAEFSFYDGKKKKYNFSYEDGTAGFLHGENFYCFELDKDGQYFREVKNNTECWYKVKKNDKPGDYYLVRNERTNETKMYEGEQLITDTP